MNTLRKWIQRVCLESISLSAPIAGLYELVRQAGQPLYGVYVQNVNSLLLHIALVGFVNSHMLCVDLQQLVIMM